MPTNTTSAKTTSGTEAPSAVPPPPAAPRDRAETDAYGSPRTPPVATAHADADIRSAGVHGP